MCKFNEKQIKEVASKLGINVEDVTKVTNKVTGKNPNYNTINASVKNIIGYHYLIDIKTSELRKYHNEIIKNFIKKNESDYNEDTKTFKTVENQLELMKLQNVKTKSMDGCSTKQKELSGDLEKFMGVMYKSYTTYVSALLDTKSVKNSALYCYEYQVAKFLDKIGVVPTTIAIDNFVRAIGGTGKSASTSNSDTYVGMSKDKYITSVVKYLAQMMINKNIINVEVLKNNTNYVAKIKDAKVQDIANEIQDILSEI